VQNIAGVVIHRNFSTGTGYAYDGSSNEKTVESVIELMKQKQNLPTPNSSRIPMAVWHWVAFYFF
jgi:hypothetical protein